MLFFLHVYFIIMITVNKENINFNKIKLNIYTDTHNV